MIKSKRQKSDIRTQFIQLASHLRQESLYVTSERAQLKRLNEKVLHKWQDVIRAAWVARQQRLALEVGFASAIGTGSAADQASATRLYNVLERVRFVESYRILGPSDVHYSDLLSLLRRDTHSLACLLSAIEKRPLSDPVAGPSSGTVLMSNDRLAELVTTSLYGNCLFQEDRTLVASLLRELIHRQLIASDNPRRQLRQGNCLTARIYKHFTEGIFETKLFLTASLHKSVLLVLQQDDLYLDVDPLRNVSRFAPDERRRHFGLENTAEFDTNLEKYKSWTISRLVSLVTHFIDGIQSQIACFPAWNIWLIRQLLSLMSGHFPEREVCAVGSDLVFGLFICPAILNPELYGITDAHISHIARYNLMQIAQIIQRLAMLRWESTGTETTSKEVIASGKMEAILERIPRDGIFSVLDTILGQTPAAGSPPMPPLDENEVQRTSILITHSQLVDLVTTLNKCKHSTDPSESHAADTGSTSGLSKENHKKIFDILSQIQLPEIPSHLSLHPHTDSGFSLIDRSELSRVSPIVNHSSTSSPIVNARNLINKVTRKASRPSTNDLSNTSMLSGQLPGSSGTGSSTASGTDPLAGIEDVLILPLSQNFPLGSTANEPMTENSLLDGIGLQPEDKVLVMDSELARRKSRVRVQLDSQSDQLLETESIISATSGDGAALLNQTLGVGPHLEKKTRFSLSVDQESVGTMDNLEAISEAASNHSVDSSIETAEDENDAIGIGDENEVDNLINDNLSDMVSANVSSGRGSPNVSGRDSPISRDSSTESDDNDGPHNDSGPQGVANLPETVARAAEQQAPIAPSPPRPNVNVARNTSSGQPVPLSQPTVQLPSRGVPLSARLPGHARQPRHHGHRGPLSGTAAALRSIPVTHHNRLNNREDIEDKFGKFDVKHQVGPAGDETKSIMSDTWSTDVLASDSEQPDPPERSTPTVASCHDAALGHDRASHPASGLSGAGPSSGALSVFDESQSDAWSTSVAASDTARFQDFDQDETASSTRSESLVDRNDLDELSAQMQSMMSGRAGPPLTPQKDMAKKVILDDKTSQSNSISVIQEDDSDPHHLTESTDSTDTVNQSVTLRNSGSLHKANGAVSEVSDPFSHLQTLGRLSLDICKLDELASATGPSTHLVNSLSPSSPPILIASTNNIPSNTSQGASMLNGNRRSQNNLMHFDANSAEEGDDEDAVIVSIESCSPEELSPVSPGPRSAAVLVSTSSPNTIGTNGNSSTGAIPKTKLLPSANQNANVSLAMNGSTPKGKTNGGRRFNLPTTIRGIKEKILTPANQRSNLQATANTNVSSDKVSPSPQAGPSNAEATGLPRNESSDDILEKYRSPLPSNAVSTNVHDNNHARKRLVSDPDTIQCEESDDVWNLDEVTIMLVARRKLRRVLSQMDVRNLPVIPVSNSIVSQQNSSESGRGLAADETSRSTPNTIVRLLRVLLAEATCLQNASLVVNLHEAIRMVSLLDDSTCDKLLAAVRDDFQRRSVYIAYLSRSRNQLLSIESQLEYMATVVRREVSATALNLIGSFVRHYLEGRDDGASLTGFVASFRSLSSSTPPAPSDERTNFVRQYLSIVMQELSNEPTWATMTEEQRQLTERSAERLVMREIYIYAFYPNGDGDVMRDQILHEHILRLRASVSLNHRSLRIPRRYHLEAPWPRAQTELSTINAYKSPRDKVQCVVRTCAILMNLLSHAAGIGLGTVSSESCEASGGTTSMVPAAADDLLPVLVFVIIQANPLSLLSTVQFVGDFYGNLIESEDEYWWTIFASAIEFIKTMD